MAVSGVLCQRLGQSFRDLRRAQSTVDLLDSQASSRRAISPGEEEITVNHYAFLRPNRRKDLLMVGVWEIDGASCVREVRTSSTEQLFLVPQMIRKNCG